MILADGAEDDLSQVEWMRIYPTEDQLWIAGYNQVLGFGFILPDDTPSDEEIWMVGFGEVKGKKTSAGTVCWDEDLDACLIEAREVQSGGGPSPA